MLIPPNSSLILRSYRTRHSHESLCLIPHDGAIYAHKTSHFSFDQTIPRTLNYQVSTLSSTLNEQNRCRGRLGSNYYLDNDNPDRNESLI